MHRIPLPEIARIRQLRKTGYSLPEIKKIVGRGSGTVFRYARGVSISPKFVEALRSKQGGSKARSRTHWETARTQSARLIGRLTSRDKLLVLAALYWGEGTKSELNIINGDASLLRVFIVCLEELGIQKAKLRFSLRLFEDIEERQAKRVWARELGVKAENIHVSELSRGKRRGKLPFGMCRIRLQKSGPYFKLIMSMIESIKSALSPRSSMDRTAAS